MVNVTAKFSPCAIWVGQNGFGTGTFFFFEQCSFSLLVAFNQ